ncbi:MAG: hypothetical protein GX131_20185 [candidate division WS1 bacterium]|jgi:transcriptional regulator with XRE-family HTH domain|nr:hypothetical protein [candidate division WS1 bacterium]
MDLREESGRKELGRRIQSAIAHAGYPSLPAFAEALGCSRALIYQYVSGDVLVQLDRLTAIAELTGRALDWFIVQDPGGAAGEIQRVQAQVDELASRCETLEAALARERGARIADAEAARRSLLEALQELCRAQRASGDMHGLTKSAARCAEIARQLGDEPALMAAQLHAGHAAFGLGKREDAEEALRSALSLAQALSDERAELAARQELVRVQQASGRLEEAREQAAELAATERWWPRWAGRVAMAAIDEQRCDLPSAEALLDEAEQIIAEPEAPLEHVAIARVYVLSNRVNLLLARGHYADADREAQRLHELAAGAGLPDQVREATLNRAIAALRRDDSERAGELLQQLREWAELAGDRRIAGLAAIFEAERLLRTGEPVSARRLAMDAIELGNGSINGAMVAEAELVLGMACIADDLYEDATYHLTHSHERAGRLRLQRIAVASALRLAEAKSRLGEADATGDLREATEAARGFGYDDLVAEGEEMLKHLPDVGPGGNSE